jgi:hypothetical protein
MGKVRVLSGGARSILSSPEMLDHLRAVMEPVLARARETAPVVTGAHRDSLRIDARVVGDRAVARLVATAPHSRIVEARTGHMSRALDAAGGAL